MDIREESPFDALVAGTPGERFLFVASVCPLRPLDTIKFYLGPKDDLLTLFPEILDDLGSSRPVGTIYHLTMGKKYPHIGALQVDLKFPIWAINKNLAMAGLEVVYATCGMWSHTHLVCPRVLGNGRVVKELLQLLTGCPPQVTLWTGDLSIL